MEDSFIRTKGEEEVDRENAAKKDKSKTKELLKVFESIELGVDDVNWHLGHTHLTPQGRNKILEACAEAGLVFRGPEQYDGNRRLVGHGDGEEIKI